MRRSHEQGMTLVEVLIAAMVFSIALGGLLNGLSNIAEIIDVARDKSVAVKDLETMLEHARAVPFDLLTTRFPNGTVDGPGAFPYLNYTGTHSLASEHITVTYVNPNADPMEIRVTTTWIDKRTRARNISMSTFRTR
jgi:prepilin-type N-terminal cleavage/methylation domain-containing protein